jgi:hypothetical protein
MTWYIILGTFTLLIVVSMILFIREIKKAPLIPETEPFLKGDAAPTGEEYFRYFNTFCKNCKFFDKTATCLHEDNFGLIDEHKSRICKKRCLFEPN